MRTIDYKVCLFSYFQDSITFGLATQSANRIAIFIVSRMNRMYRMFSCLANAICRQERQRLFGLAVTEDANTLSTLAFVELLGLQGFLRQCQVYLL